MPDPGDTAFGDNGQGTTSSSGLGKTTSSSSSGFGTQNVQGSNLNSASNNNGYGNSNFGSSNNNNYGGTYGSSNGSGFGTQNVQGSNLNSASNNNGYGSISNSGFGTQNVRGSNLNSFSSNNGYSPKATGGVSGIASSGNFNSFNGPGVSALNAPATAGSAQAYSGYRSPEVASPSRTEGIASLGNQSGFADFRGPGVSPLNAPAGMGNLSTPQGLYGPRVGAQPPGVPNYMNPAYQPGYNVGDIPMSRPSGWPEPVSTEGANSPFADPSVQAYNPLDSFNNYVMPTAQALAGTPAGMSFAPNYPAQISYSDYVKAGGVRSVVPNGFGAAQQMPGFNPKELSPFRPINPNNYGPAVGNVIGITNWGNPNAPYAKLAGAYIGDQTVNFRGATGYGQLYNPEPQQQPQPQAPSGPASGNIVSVSNLASPVSDAYKYVGDTDARWNALSGYGRVYNPLVNTPQQMEMAPQPETYSTAPPAAAPPTGQNPQGPFGPPDFTPPDELVADNTPYSYPPATAPSQAPPSSVAPSQGTKPILQNPGWPNDTGGNGNQPVPAAAPPPGTPPDDGTDDGTDDGDTDGLAWMKYYPSSYGSQSQVVPLPELTYLKDPVSSGVGSLFPQIQITPYSRQT